MDDITQDDPGSEALQYTEHLSDKADMIIMIQIPRTFNADSSDMEAFLVERGQKVDEEKINELGREFQQWYRKNAPDEYRNPEMEGFTHPPSYPAA